MKNKTVSVLQFRSDVEINGVVFKARDKEDEQVDYIVSIITTYPLLFMHEESVYECGWEFILQLCEMEVKEPQTLNQFEKAIESLMSFIESRGGNIHAQIKSSLESHGIDFNDSIGIASRIEEFCNNMKTRHGFSFIFSLNGSTGLSSLELSIYVKGKIGKNMYSIMPDSVLFNIYLNDDPLIEVVSEAGSLIDSVKDSVFILRDRFCGSES